MADLLATPVDLAALLQQDIDTATATLLLECATAVVQEATRQRLVLVPNETVDLDGTTDSWFFLPERPVTQGAVSSVVLDGVTLAAGTDYIQRRDRLWRAGGWQGNATLRWDLYDMVIPSTLTVTYTHGLAAGDQRLQLARSVALGLAQAGYSNPSLVSQERIDDYQVVFEVMAARLDASRAVKSALRRQYSRPVSLVRVS